MTDDAARWQRVVELFNQAIELAEDEQAGWLAAACGDDRGLYDEVWALLQHDQSATGVIRGPLAEVARDLSGDSPAPAGMAVGSFRIISPIAEGGMGAVYLAERASGDFEQRVAIKLLRGQLRSEDAKRRFVEERRILASLEHPHIARFIDGGALPDGTPYIVMEYVDGVPIDQYCRQHPLEIRALIELVLPVFDAVRYAHRNLVVHRDIKPSNILVDLSGHARLLDFGIAKLLDAESGDALAQTAADARALTPLYASPEQIEGAPITTAADVYGLGLLLYVLLTGRHPYGTDTGEVADIQRAILRSPPERPSRAVLTGTGAFEALGAQAAQAWAQRQHRLLRGDLDVILLTALRKEPERRYESVAAFAEDLRRYLTRQPIVARGDSLAYRTGKFLQRYRLPVATATVMFATIVGLVGFYTARLQTERATAEQTADFLTALFQAPDPYRRASEPLTVARLLERGSENLAADESLTPAVRSRLLGTLGTVFFNLGETGKAESLLKDALRIQRTLGSAAEPDLARILNVLARVWMRQDLFGEAREALAESTELWRSLEGADALPLASVADSEFQLGARTGDYDLMGRAAEQALAIREAHLPTDASGIATALANVGLHRWRTGSTREAERLYSRAAEILDAQPDRNEAQYASLQHNLGLLAWDNSDYEGAIAHYREALEVGSRGLGPDHPYITLTTYALAAAKSFLGDYVEAAHLYEQAIEMQRVVYGPQNSEVAFSLTGYGHLLIAMGELNRAKAAFQEAYDLYDASNLLGHQDAAATFIGLGDVALLEHAYEQGRDWMRKAYELRLTHLPEDSIGVLRARTARGRAAFAAGALAVAGEHFAAVAAQLRETGKDGHAYLGEALAWLGRSRLAQGDAEQAEALLAEARTLLAASHRETHRLRIDTDEWLADAMARNGAAAAAAELRHSAAIRREQLESNWREAAGAAAG